VAQKQHPNGIKGGTKMIPNKPKVAENVTKMSLKISQKYHQNVRKSGSRMAPKCNQQCGPKMHQNGSRTDSKVAQKYQK